MYSGSFSATLAKIRGANRPPNFLDQKTFFAALFELFCRSFGHLATVPARLTDIIRVVHQTRAIPPQIFSNRNVLE